MTPEEIDYLVEWYESGNNWRRSVPVSIPVQLTLLGPLGARINELGQTIAKLTIENRELRKGSK